MAETLKLPAGTRPALARFSFFRRVLDRAGILCDDLTVQTRRSRHCASKPALMSKGDKMAKRIPRIGILSPVTEEGMRDWWSELRRGLGDLGYVEGKTIELVWRFGDGRFERLPQLAAELVAHDVDIIMPATPPAIRAAMAAAGTTPIVFPLGSDPVETGLVASNERPGGRVTGMATMSRLQSHPRLGLVRECMPAARRVGLLRHSANYALNLQVEASQKAAAELGVEVLVLDFATSDQIADAFKAACGQTVEAILPLSDPMALDNAGRIGDLSLEYRIPVVSPFREITEAGGLLSYGPDLSKLFHRSASLVDQILKGANAGELPIGEPVDFELGANLRAARTLDVQIPASILSRATHVAE
jgi:putative ABC transport system substrate-binding protein